MITPDPSEYRTLLDPDLPVFNHSHCIWWRHAWVALDDESNARLNLAQASNCLFIVRVTLHLPGMAPSIFAVHLLVMVAVELATDLRCSVSWTDPRTGMFVRGKVRMYGVTASSSEPGGRGVPVADFLSAEDEAHRDEAEFQVKDRSIPLLNEHSGTFGRVLPGTEEWNFVLGAGEVGSGVRRRGVVAALHKINVSLEQRSHYGVSKLHIAGEVWAWHGTALQGVIGICTSGFILTQKVKNGRLFGEGVYLSKHANVNMAMHYGLPLTKQDGAKNDAYGHVLLCQVLMGNVGTATQGMDHPGRGKHTGVDSLAEPTRIIVFSNRMNTSIMPRYVLTFRWRRSEEYSCAAPGVGAGTPGASAGAGAGAEKSGAEKS